MVGRHRLGVLAPPHRLPAEPPYARSSSGGASLRGRVVRFVREERLLVTILAMTFLVRFLLADWNSYWLDELFSVEVYGRWHPSAVEAVRALGDASVHPPLYQFILYHWMEVFGHSEVATRSLSNAYIVLATLLLFLALRGTFARPVAYASVVGFALTHTAMYFGLETRSYAQSIFLVSLSSYVLLAYLLRYGGPRRARGMLVSGPGAALALANLALLMTHYYNVFFLVAQGTFLTVHALFAPQVERRIARLGWLGLSSALQIGAFALLWGEVFLHHLGLHGEDYELEERATTPWQMLDRGFLEANLPPWEHAAAIVGVLVLLLLVRCVVSLVRSPDDERDVAGSWSVIYLVSWLTLPLVAAYVASLVVGIERFVPRYFSFAVVPLAPLIALAAEQVRLSVVERLPRRGGADRGVAVVLAAVLVLLLPGTYAAATARKADWRGITRDVADIVEADPDRSYVIYETAVYPEPIADYYFRRYSDSVRVTGTLERQERELGRYRILEEERHIVERYDRLVLLFVHVRSMHLDEALTLLAERYELEISVIDDEGRGFVVFTVGGDTQAS